MLKRYGPCAAVLCLVGSAFGQADSFHVMQIEEVIGGVNGDTAKQAVQLRQRSSFQNQIQFGVLKAYDATGSNPVVLAAPSAPVPNFVAGDRILFTTAAFDASTTPACVPDLHMNAIPASYLAAGRITWEDTFGTILWSVTWGGAGYTGSTMGSLTNSTTGDFGRMPTPIPTATNQAWLFQGAATDPSSAGGNSADYLLTTGAAVFTNNARASFTVSGGPAPCYANCDASTTAPVLNVLDFSCFLNAFAAGQSYANCDNSTTPPVLNVLDFSCFLNQFAAGCT
jgi:hypothetical protein